jgi:phosphoglucosamine mutase
VAKLFGTDGVRGVAGSPPLDRDTIRRLGAALVRALPRRSGGPRLLIGRDTRESGAWIEREFGRGVESAGASLSSLGVLPTPAVAYLTRAHGYDAGVVVSASHNPYQDNGLKVFSGAGEKFTEQLEAEVEALVADASWATPSGEGGAPPSLDLLDDYVAHALNAVPGGAPPGGLHLTIDCANGATTTAAPRVFGRLGASVEWLGVDPDGRNINLDCGSTHPERLARAAAAGGGLFGAAFDGDGDRAIFADHRGRIVNGDAVLLMCARHMKATGRLAGDAVVATVMSNMGLEAALRESGIALVRCPVGDKYVMEEMIARRLSLGGEQSGHVIFADSLFTGDGIVTALNVLRVLLESGRSLASWADELTTYPQVLVNVRVATRTDLASQPAIAKVLRGVEARLAGDGRLLVRYSGTEPLLRIMIEGRDHVQIESWANEIADVVRASIG